MKCLRYVHVKCGAEVTSGDTNLKKERICPRCNERINFEPTLKKENIMLYTIEEI